MSETEKSEGNCCDCCKQSSVYNKFFGKKEGANKEMVVSKLKDRDKEKEKQKEKDKDKDKDKDNDNDKNKDKDKQKSKHKKKARHSKSGTMSDKRRKPGSVRSDMFSEKKSISRSEDGLYIDECWSLLEDIVVHFHDSDDPHHKEIAAIMDRGLGEDVESVYARRTIAKHIKQTDDHLNEVQDKINAAQANLSSCMNDVKSFKKEVCRLNEAHKQVFHKQKSENTRYRERIDGLKQKLQSVTTESGELKKKLNLVPQSERNMAVASAYDQFTKMIHELKAESEQNREALRVWDSSITEATVRTQQEMALFEARCASLDADMRRLFEEHKDLIDRLSTRNTTIKDPRSSVHMDEDRMKLVQDITKLQEKYPPSSGAGMIQKNTEEMKAVEFRDWYDKEIKQRRAWLNEQIQQTATKAATFSPFNQPGPSRVPEIKPGSTSTGKSSAEMRGQLYAELDQCINKLIESTPKDNRPSMPR